MLVWRPAPAPGLPAPPGRTGSWALWAQCPKSQIATAGVAPTGAAIIHGSAVAYVVGFNSGLGGNTATLDILLMPPRPDYF